MNKNRAHATHMLAKKSSALYAAIADGEKKQMGVNGMLQDRPVWLQLTRKIPASVPRLPSPSPLPRSID